MGNVELGPRIRVLREQAGLLAKDLAEVLDLDASGVSRLESGEREIKAHELATVAGFLGVSQLSILQPDSLLGRMPVSPRSLGHDSPPPTATFERLTGLAELHQVLFDEGEFGQPRSGEAPRVKGRNLLEAALNLSEWARGELDAVQTPSGDVFKSLSAGIEDAFGIDVLVEPCEPTVDGASITDDEFPFILVSSSIPQYRALFTLAHELGHVLSGDGSTLNVDQGLEPHSDRDRLANAFAADFLMPEAQVRSTIREYGRTPEALAAMMLTFGVSFESLIYRLHNLGIINTSGRDRLSRGVQFVGVLNNVSRSYRKRLLQLTAKPAEKHPTHLVDRLWNGFSGGIVGPAPLANLLGVSISEIIAVDRESASITLQQDFSECQDHERADIVRLHRDVGTYPSGV